MAFHIIRNDITKTPADAIVNTANPYPLVGSGTDSAIYEAAGYNKLLTEREKIGQIAPGEAAETPAFDLPAKYIIHTVGPAWLGGNSRELETLRSCYVNSLDLAKKLGCQSIAFPLISSGNYGFPKDKALSVALSVIQPFVMENDMDITLCVFNKEAFQLSGTLVEHVREYVDANYVAEAVEKEYFRRPDVEGRRPEGLGNWVGLGNIPMPMANMSVIGNVRPENAKIEENRRPRFLEELEEQRRKFGDRRYAAEEFEADKDFAPDEEFAANEESVYQHVNIEDMLKNSEKTFQEKLFEIIDERGLTGPQVYKNYISKQVYSKIQADPYYHPNKYTAIALCLSLHLTVEETQDLIGRAGWTLSRSNTADLVVQGCIINHEYNIVKINCILFEYDCPELEKIK